MENKDVIDDFEYDRLFKLTVKSPLKKRDLKKQKAALKKAWENRDFEIDLFWRRSAYFWGFIALIFGAYFKILTARNYETLQEMRLDLYIILLGGIFSVAWMLAIKGSKCWQENWEAHIDKLSDEITGPLYKVIYCTKRNFYSVSNINLILAWVVIVTWGVLFLQYLFKHTCKINYIFSLIIPIVLTEAGFFAIFALIHWGKSKGGGRKVKLEEGEKGKFIAIKKIKQHME